MSSRRADRSALSDARWALIEPILVAWREKRAGLAAYLIDHAQYVKDNRTLPVMLDLEWPYKSGGAYIGPYPCWGLTPRYDTTVGRLPATAGVGYDSSS